MARTEITKVYHVKSGSTTRKVTYRALDRIAVEDCTTMLLAAVLHRYATGEDVVPPISREIKDALIKQNLVI